MFAQPTLSWLRPPQLADRTASRQAAMVWGLLWGLLVTSIPIIFAVDFGGSSFIGLIVADILFVGLLGATRIGYVRFAGIAIPTLLLVLTTFINVASDGTHDIGIVAYMTIIAIAALLVGTRALITFTLLSVACFTAIAAAEINGRLVNTFSYKTTTEDIVIFAAICTIFAILLRVTLQHLIDSLQLARAGERAVVEHNAQLEASRAEIQRLNTDLERRIAERTAALQSATEENQQLYDISRDINRAQDYVDVVEAVARHLDQPDYNVTMALYDTHNKATAQILSVVAQRPSGKPHAQPVIDDHYAAHQVRAIIDSNVTLVVDDASMPPQHLHTELVDTLQIRKAGSFMISEVGLNRRVMGYIMLALPHAHVFSPHDIRVMGAVSDLAAAAIERIRLYSEQVDTADRLRDADEVKSRFMANMSHELRTPLNAILNFTRFVSSGMLGSVNAEQADALNKTISSGKHLLSLINDVLDVTKIESKMLTLFVEANVNLTEEADAAIAAGEALLGEKPVKIVRDIADDLPLMIGDRRRLRQVLLNLMSNACKFTTDGRITLSARVEGDSIVLRVDDTGPGIPKDDLEVIFEPFRQTKRGLMATGGTGLGLAIARRLIEAHHGTLDVVSTPGEGAAFTIMLPIAAPALSAQIESMEFAS